MLKTFLNVRNVSLLGLRCSRMSSSSVFSGDQFWHSSGKEDITGAAVLVCGWAGSKRSNVEKYTDLVSMP
jgi:hypothetical protein